MSRRISTEICSTRYFSCKIHEIKLKPQEQRGVTTTIEAELDEIHPANNATAAERLRTPNRTKLQIWKPSESGSVSRNWYRFASRTQGHIAILLLLYGVST